MLHDNSGYSIEMIYPKDNSRIYIPVDLNGDREKVVFKAAHHIGGLKIYWYLDGVFLGITSDFHQMGLSPPAGMHKLTLVDQKGENITVNFEIIDKKKK
jgi:penicillin-binding protein 1C